TPKSRAVACGFSVSKYGAQQSVDPYQADCGNGVTTGGANITGNDPLDTSTAITQTFVQDWMQHLIGRYGTAANGGVLFYDLDNEPMLWNSTHRDVHPNATSYDEMRDRTYQYAPAMKSVDPSAPILGPVLWGWDAYFYSALDLSTRNSDRLAHGNVPFVAWYLQQMQAYEQQNGTRILDYLDLHYYPQATGVTLSPAGNATTQALRLRSTRSLWDATYADESWIAQTAEGPYVRLIPRMRDWVNSNYPGTKIAIGEYNWGALDDINGALAQADVLGIFGREAVDLAALWDPPTSAQPGAFAFRMYRNYDGAGEMFGDVSVQAASTDQGQLAVYAAQRSSDNALTLIVINKTNGALTASVALSGFTPASVAQVFRYSASNLSAIVPQPDQMVSAAGFSATFPGASITLIVLPVGSTGGGTPSNVFLPFLER
ncbi:MAG: glycoside hydrolase family 44 protein, partial [Chloroflexota bacterium]|nr:glycoside hydrolase family 44 protein [Chloroflexota bacterium]